MNNLVLDKENFGKVLNQFYAIIQDDTSNIVVSYEILKTHPRHRKSYSFLRNVEKSPIKFKEDPLSFQKSLRNEWK